MRTLLDSDELEDKSSEITLSTASLLGVFFGLVLVCGVFFGFGYSMGRGTQTKRPALASAVGTPEPQETVAAEAPPPAVAEPTDQQEDLPPAPKPVAPAVVLPAKPAEVKPAAPKKPTPGRLIADSPAIVAANKSAPSGTGQPMVQIAAVARREDADVLVSALRQRGYGVVVRNEPQDKLLHVQVGPFADRTQAAAIKQKLLSDGYNAIIKQ